VTGLLISPGAWGSASRRRSQKRALRTLRLDFEHFERARSRLLGLGRAVEVLEPEPLRLSLLDYARQVVNLYAEG